jgi:Flp pilus assembly protein CpaB
LILDARDNIAVCLTDLKAGDVVEQDDISIKVINPIPRGHKIASKAIAKDEGIIKYGERMGHAIAPIAVGEHVHVHNILGDRLSTEKP